MQKTDIKSLNMPELRAAAAEMGLPSFRAGQIYKWLHKAGVTEFSEMTDIPLKLREKLNERYTIFACSIAKKLISEYDNTVKYLFRLHDGEFVESVLMQYSYGYTLCVSTQVGCKMACTFCASTIGGCVRNLHASEMLGQIHAAEKDMGVRVSHIVLMGMGEPLDNFEETLRFLELVSDENGLHIGMRNISLSTCGIVPRIYDLMEKRLQLTLSVSLHAPNDALRSQIMPVNRKWGVDELLEACRKYAKVTSRRISFEYVMIHDVNDTQACANELAAKLRGILCHINLIPVNEVRGRRQQSSSAKRLDTFVETLSNKGYAVTVRRRLGFDIDASCGQLRRTVSDTEGAV
ncbi:MAG: 23S rRNA (adenine(2503)-C(2))-methyltransferase RlmN [Oscillospiraceae bacterium]|jgi:23S rRNA (adenine2503-C2)-methyltransferase|nr:23S rRNA (adenine(2503)-C(2))-methyltransferase RlmN [Oscillospiraceae bacterium]